MVKLKRLFVDHALSSGSQVKLLMPLLGETGALWYGCGWFCTLAGRIGISVG